MRAKNRPERICQATLLAMGWTKSMIARLLPEPELVDNPHYKCASPMKLWDKRMVLSLMDTDAFNKLALEGARRSQASKRAFQTRKQNLQEEVLRIAKEFSIPLLNDEELREKAIDSRIKYYEAIENEYENEYYDEDDDDDEDRRYDEPFTINHLTEETISRWVVNYIRHELIDYDYVLHTINNKPGHDVAYVVFKRAVLTKIADTYPLYALECRKQMPRLEECA